MEFIVAIKTWASSSIPAAIGSLLALYVGREKNAKMTRIELFAVFIFGVALAHYLGGAAIEYTKIDHISLTADAIKLTVGLLGMAVLTNIFDQVPIAITALRKKWMGE